MPAKPDIKAKSMFDDMPKKPTQKEFDESVKQSVKQMEVIADLKNKLFNKANDLVNMLNDKKLRDLKSSIEIQYENDTIAEFVNLIKMVDEDMSNSSFDGTIAGITVLVKMLVRERNRLNEIEFKFKEINSRLEKLENGK